MDSISILWIGWISIDYWSGGIENSHIYQISNILLSQEGGRWATFLLSCPRTRDLSCISFFHHMPLFPRAFFSSGLQVLATVLLYGEWVYLPQNSVYLPVEEKEMADQRERQCYNKVFFLIRRSENIIPVEGEMAERSKAREWWQTPLQKAAPCWKVVKESKMQMIWDAEVSWLT